MIMVNLKSHLHAIFFLFFKIFVAVIRHKNSVTNSAVAANQKNTQEAEVRLDGRNITWEKEPWQNCLKIYSF